MASPYVPLFLILLLLPSVVLCVRPARVQLDELDLEIIPGEQIKVDAATSKDVGNATTDCELCVGFMQTAVVVLGAVIAGGGAVSCPDLCHKAFNNSQTAVDICEGLCYVVGFAAFEKLLTDADPDPVWICEMINVCAYNDNDNATILAAVAKPRVGVQGRTFTFHLEWTLTTWAGVADLNVNVSGPGGAGTFSQNYYNWQTGIDYEMDITLKTKPSKSDPWTPGNYTFLLQLCEGDCGCTHTHGCKLVVETTINFEITPNPKTTTVATMMSSTGSAVYYSSGGGGSSGEALPRIRNQTTGRRRILA